MPITANPRQPPFGLLSLLALGALFVLIQYALPGLLPHPVRADDYANVGSTFADMGLQWKRPVSANLIFFAAGFGPAASYAFLCALAVIDAALVLWLLARIFGVRVPPAVVLAFGIAVFSHVSAFSHATYLGLLTNLISHFFGLLTLLALWRGWRTGRGTWWVLAAVAFAASAFAKEDFLLPPLLLVTLLWMRAPDAAIPFDAQMRRNRWLVAAAIVAIAAGSLWNAYDRNPFVAGLFSPDTSTAAYAVDLSPAGLARAQWTLLFAFAPQAFVAATLAWIAMFAAMPRQRLPLFWYAVTVIALVLPYAMISRNMPPFRVYAWLPWYAGLVAVALAFVHARCASRGHRIALATLALAIASLLAWTHWPQRAQAVATYAQQAALNRRIVDTLRAQRAALADAPVVGLSGLGESSPWCAQDGAYVNGRLGFEGKKWIVFVPAPTCCYTQQAPDARRKRGIYVSVVETTRLCGYGALPVLVFDADGTGRLARANAVCRAPR